MLSLPVAVGGKVVVHHLAPITLDLCRYYQRKINKTARLSGCTDTGDINGLQHYNIIYKKDIGLEVHSYKQTSSELVAKQRKLWAWREWETHDDNGIGVGDMYTRFKILRSDINKASNDF